MGCSRIYPVRTGERNQSSAQKDVFDDLDVEEFEIVATLDSHTMDGQRFPMKNFESGITSPQFHVWCSSTTVPYFDGEWSKKGERAVREEDGKTYYVPVDMIYKEWKNGFADGDTDELTSVFSDDTIISGE